MGAESDHRPRLPRFASLQTCHPLSAALLGLGLCLHTLSTSASGDVPLTRIAFGSCANQNLPEPIWNDVLEIDPQLFILAGDNIYADTQEREVMERKYAQFAAVPGFKALRARCPLLATWDDHDYGQNDAGAEFPAKEMAKACFMAFFDIPTNAPMRHRAGVYSAHLFGPPGQRVQIILLDTRTFRGPLTRLEQRPKGSGPYRPTTDPAASMLGGEQWAWLEEQLLIPADVRLLVSSIQVVGQDHAWEKWMNFPHERDRLINLLNRCQADGVIVLSGDRHAAELSRLDGALPYPLYDLTSSALNQKRPPGDDANRYRVGPLVMDHNFGLVRLDWEHDDGPVVTLELITPGGTVALSQNIPLRRLQGHTAEP